MRHVRYVVQPEDRVWVILDTSAGIPWKAVAKYPSREEAEIKAWEMNKMQMFQAEIPKGHCYEDAWRYFVKKTLPGTANLVHGSVEIAGRRMNHAWVDLFKAGYIWEPQTMELIERKEFSWLYKPSIDYMYSYKQAMRLAFKTKNTGPWTEQEREKYLGYTQTAITQAEWQHAKDLWGIIKEDAEKGEEVGTYLWSLLVKYYPNEVHKQIKLVGYMNELIRKYPQGKVPLDVAVDLAKKWGVEKMLVREALKFLPWKK